MAGIGFVYVMTNPAMPGIVKVGMTDRSPHARAMELSAGTSIPYPFAVEYYVEVVSPREVEADFHDAMADFRVNQNREFFAMPVEQAICEISLGVIGMEGILSSWHSDKYHPSKYESFHAFTKISILPNQINSHLSDARRSEPSLLIIDGGKK